MVDETLIGKEKLKDGLLVTDILVECGAAKSKREARTLIKQGGITLFVGPYYNKISDVNHMVDLPKHVDVSINEETKRIWIIPEGWELK